MSILVRTDPFADMGLSLRGAFWTWLIFGWFPCKPTRGYPHKKKRDPQPCPLPGLRFLAADQRLGKFKSPHPLGFFRMQDDQRLRQPPPGCEMLGDEGAIPAKSSRCPLFFLFYIYLETIRHEFPWKGTGPSKDFKITRLSFANGLVHSFSANNAISDHCKSCVSHSPYQLPTAR